VAAALESHPIKPSDAIQPSAALEKSEMVQSMYPLAEWVGAFVVYSSAGVGKVSLDRDPLLPPGRERSKPVTVDP